MCLGSVLLVFVWLLLVVWCKHHPNCRIRAVPARKNGAESAWLKDKLLQKIDIVHIMSLDGHRDIVFLIVYFVKVLDVWHIQTAIGCKCTKTYRLDMIMQNNLIIQYNIGHASIHQVYGLNFGETCSRRNIEQLSLKDLEGFDLSLDGSASIFFLCVRGVFQVWPPWLNQKRSFWSLSVCVIVHSIPWLNWIRNPAMDRKW